jgi:hypothetical protein
MSQSQTTTPETTNPENDNPAEGLLESIVFRLTPLFMQPGRTEQDAARMARNAIAAYEPRAADEYAIIGRIIADTLNALTLSARLADPNLPETQLLRLASKANSLSRSAQQAERLLLQNRKAAVRQETLAEPARPAKSEKSEPAVRQRNNTVPQARKAFMEKCQDDLMDLRPGAIRPGESEEDVEAIVNELVRFATSDHDRPQMRNRR